MTRFASLRFTSALRFTPAVRGWAVTLSVAALAAGCAAMESLPPEQLSALQAKAQACSEALPDVTHHAVDRFGRVQASVQGPEAELIHRNFLDCVKSRKRPNGDVVVGHRSALASHLGNIAYLERRRIELDLVREEVRPG